MNPAFLKDLLQRYWNHSSFRPMQEEIIMSVMEGKDTLALLPTGAGKSVCYQLPALALDGFTLVISPLVALMQDQVMQLSAKDIPAAYIHSGMRQGQVEKVLARAAANECKLLYVSPERLLTPLFQNYIPYFNINMIAVDEAHCTSQWGHDFRPAYSKIGDFRRFFPGKPLLAVTASANDKVRQDILELLQMKNAAFFRGTVVRENLFYEVYYAEDKPKRVTDLFQANRSSSILYCRSRKRCAEADLLLKQKRLDSGVYHAGLQKEERDAMQKRWTDSHSAIMCATTAFGMGIDKPDVRCVVHYDVPESIEAYDQETGRAGRDGNRARAVMWYNGNDVSRLRESVDLQYPPEPYLRKVYQWVGDYLKIAVGSGLEEFRAFDALLFIHNFKLETLRALSAIRLLDREGLWLWNENANIYTTVQFTTDRATLNYLEQTEPPLFYIASSLLRLYGSIFYHPTTVKEFEVSRILRIEKPQLDKGLNRLASLGIIDYQPAESGGTLYWLRERLADQHLFLDMRRIERLRQAQRERIEHMIAYFEDQDTCRNILLAQYFGEQTGTVCGGCDCCVRNNKNGYKPAGLKKQLLQLIKEQGSVPLRALALHFPGEEETFLIAQLRQLCDERLCRISAGDIIFAG